MQFARLGSLSVCFMYFFGALFVVILLFRSRTPTSEGGEKGFVSTLRLKLQPKGPSKITEP